jgi:hypothetical protein
MPDYMLPIQPPGFSQCLECALKVLSVVFVFRISPKQRGHRRRIEFQKAYCFVTKHSSYKSVDPVKNVSMVGSQCIQFCPEHAKQFGRRIVRVRVLKWGDEAVSGDR